MDRPLSVNRVNPPTTTVPKTKAPVAIIHQPTMGRVWEGTVAAVEEEEEETAED
jgi:hypothetical protein